MRIACLDPRILLVDSPWIDRRPADHYARGVFRHRNKQRAQLKGSGGSEVVVQVARSQARMEEAAAMAEMVAAAEAAAVMDLAVVEEASLVEMEAKEAAEMEAVATAAVHALQKERGERLLRKAA